MADCLTPEDLTAEHLSIARTAQDFWTAEVAPSLAAIQRKDPGVLLGVLRKSAELGFTGISIPERFGGMELDLASVMIIEECFARDASYLVTHGAQAGIGALPLIYFGTEEQKSKYLPKLANATMIGAYALTEPQAGTDAMAIRTRADLSPDGKHYVLNGQKMWITNGGIADLLTVFAKVGGEKFTAFLVERAYPGVTSGAEEHKMGLHGSSTTALYLDNVSVPVENVLGEVGRGHIIAFNVLNIGRLKIGPYAVGASKEVLALSLAYARERKAFGKTIAEFGAIQHKLAEMAVRIFAVESMYWRVVGQIQQASAIKDLALECSGVKVYASEAVGYVVDEGVQIHGGYGYHQDYAVERFYRDARIFRIFEGTNEINRVLILNQLMKRLEQGKVAFDMTGFRPALDKFGSDFENQQEVATALSDMVIEFFLIESAWLRVQKLEAAGKGANAMDMFAVLQSDSEIRMGAPVRALFGACGLDTPARPPEVPVDTIMLRRKIARRLLDAGRYVV